MAPYKWILGLDIGGTKTSVVLGDSEGRILHKIRFATETKTGFDSIFSRICNACEEMFRWGDQHSMSPQCLSISIGGPLDLESGMILSPPNLPGWDNIPLKELLWKAFHLPVHIEHDGNAGAIAEWLFGAARGCKNVIFLTMGTGFGGGLILNNKIYRGASCLAGEVGHLRLSKDGPFAFGKHGSWESFCSGTGIGRLAALRFPQKWGSAPITPKELAKLAKNGDQDAIDLFNEVGRWLGQGLSLLVDILNPEIIVIGALAVRLGDLVLKPAKEIVQKEALPGAVAICKIVPAQLGEELGDKAALCAALSMNASG